MSETADFAAIDTTDPRADWRKVAAAQHDADGETLADAHKRAFVALTTLVTESSSPDAVQHAAQGLRALGWAIACAPLNDALASWLDAETVQDTAAARLPYTTTVRVLINALETLGAYDDRTLNALADIAGESGNPHQTAAACALARSGRWTNDILMAWLDADDNRDRDQIENAMHTGGTRLIAGLCDILEEGEQHIEVALVFATRMIADLLKV